MEHLDIDSIIQRLTEGNFFSQIYEFSFFFFIFPPLLYFCQIIALSEWVIIIIVWRKRLFFFFKITLERYDT